ncbi:TPA: hypothetical protein N0F65_001197 [Lagenidium giganteum]|uniref:RING-type domain-containing protein n=1 Tax=Lagenidium giganteum TaxID=4803 RepID=A0AAV2Z2U2_9STRA|nr:TPA: hypothetical protein N0F65_001197 [Lagenidium giganteum]
MFIVINGSDNPWMIALLLLAQVLVPLLQSSTDSEASTLVSIIIILVLFVSIVSISKLSRFLSNLYTMRGQFPAMGWWEYVREAYRRAIAAAATEGTSDTPSSADSENYDKVMRTIQIMPTEEFRSPADLAHASIAELKERLRRRGVDYVGCVERKDLLDLLVKYRGGPSNNDTCCICCEEYQSGDVLRLLRKCKHEFHLECLDRWAFTSVNSQRIPCCPLYGAVCGLTSAYVMMSFAVGLYSYGEGFLGSLGTGTYTNVDVPTELPTTKDLAIKDISAGWAHAGFITDDGTVYAYGRTHSFRDVIRSTNIQRIAPRLLSWMNNFTLTKGFDTMLPEPVKLPENVKAKKVVCSAALTLILTECGKLYAFGANMYGQCGTGVESTSVHEPELVQVADGAKVIDIAAGYQHALAVTEDGSVFSWGKGERGQLGFGTANVSAPQQIIALKGKNIAQVSAGFNHSSALTADGELFLWGKLLNPLGKEESNGDQIVPRVVRTSSSVRLLQCSHFHTSFITSDDKIWVVGRTPSARQEVDDNLVHVSSAMHTAPFQVANDGILAVDRVHKMGKGVDNTTFVTMDGDVFEWNFTFGLQRLQDTTKMSVKAIESGFRYRLLLGDSK